MGVSTNAYLYFGFDFFNPEDDEDGRPDWSDFPRADGEDEDEHLDVGEWEDVWAARVAGVMPPTVPYNKVNDKPYHEYWDRKRKVLELCPCEIGNHCSSEYPVWFVALKKASFSASRGDSKEIDLPEITESDLQALRDFCKAMDITWQEPKWRLASYWG